MQAVFIYLHGHDKFDPAKLKRDLQSIDGVSEINGANLSDSPVACLYTFDDQTVIVRLGDNLETISLDSNSETSWNLSMELQKREARPLRIFNDNYHFSLKGIASLNKLKQRIETSYFDEQATALEPTPVAA